LGHHDARGGDVDPGGDDVAAAERVLDETDPRFPSDGAMPLLGGVDRTAVKRAGLLAVAIQQLLMKCPHVSHRRTLLAVVLNEDRDRSLDQREVRRSRRSA